MKKDKTIFLSVSLFFFSILIDQFSKYIIRSQSGFYICNPGISFGLTLPTFLFYPLWLVIFATLVYIFFKKYPVHSYAILLILAGSLSNLIDRICFGCVIDFIDLKIWPVFNLADSSICIGVLLLLIQLNRK